MHSQPRHEHCPELIYIKPTNTMNSYKLGRIGHGHFGGALEKHMNGITSHELDIAHSREESPIIASNNSELVMMVKPNHVGAALRQIRDSLEDSLIISFSAAVPSEWMQSIVGDKAQVVRAMADIDFKQIMCQEHDRSAEILTGLSEYPLIQTANEQELDSMTALIGCLPGIAAWILKNHVEQADQWLKVWSSMTQDTLGIPLEVTQAIISKAMMDGKYDEKIAAVATPGGITAAIVEGLDQGERSHRLLYQRGMDRIDAIARNAMKH